MNRKKLPEYLTKKEVDLLLETISREGKNFAVRDRLIVETMFWAGLRVSEVVNLNVENVRTDLEPPRLEIKNAKGGKDRDLPINPEVLARLNLYIQQTRDTKAKYSRANPVFMNINGRRLTTRRIGQLVKKYAQQSGIQKNIHPHTLRHSFASYLVEKGVDLNSIRELLGHEAILTTEIYLNHIRSFDKKAEAYGKILNGVQL